MAYALYSAMESMSTKHIVSPVCDSTSAAGKPYSSYRPVHARWTIFAFFRSRCRHQYFLNGVHEINGNGNGYLLDHIFVFTSSFLQKKEKMNLTHIERLDLLSYSSMSIWSSHWEWSWRMILFCQWQPSSLFLPRYESPLLKNHHRTTNHFLTSDLEFLDNRYYYSDAFSLCWIPVSPVFLVSCQHIKKSNWTLWEYWYLHKVYALSLEVE